MILQELTKYYFRLNDNPEADINEAGFSKENISFRIKITLDGQFTDPENPIEDLRTQKGKNFIPFKITVPKFDGKRTNGIKPYFLWDKTDYLIGIKKVNENEILTPKHHDAFIDLIDKVTNSVEQTHPAINSIKKFCTDKNNIKILRASTHWDDFLNSFVVFSINGLTQISVFDLQEINQIWKKYYNFISEGTHAKKGICLVTGENTTLAPILPTIKKGIGGKNDVPLISINIKSAESFGFEKSANAPISVSAASALTGALNYLIDTPGHHLTIGDTKLLFWAESYDPFADLFSQMLDKRPDSGESKELNAYLDSLRKGKLPPEFQNKGRFFVLGLAPNSARISVRFWYIDTIDSLALKIGKHFEDIQIIPDKKEIKSFNPSLWQLLIETAVRHETQNIKPNLAGPFLQSILAGTSYPVSLLALLMDRVRTEPDSKKSKKIGLHRAAFIKAILNRNYSKEITMSLDTSRNSVPYLLGRLFAVLEKVQEESAGGKLNATIKDKYFASASTTPRRVFPLLLKLTQNHFKKLNTENKGLGIIRDKTLGEIMDRLQSFPATLVLEDQGEFAIGYYHQRQDFYKGKDNSSTETEV